MPQKQFKWKANWHCLEQNMVFHGHSMWCSVLEMNFDQNHLLLVSRHKISSSLLSFIGVASEPIFSWVSGTLALIIYVCRCRNCSTLRIMPDDTLQPYTYMYARFFSLSRPGLEKIKIFSNKSNKSYFFD